MTNLTLERMWRERRLIDAPPLPGLEDLLRGDGLFSTETFSASGSPAKAPPPLPKQVEDNGETRMHVPSRSAASDGPPGSSQS